MDASLVTWVLRVQEAEALLKRRRSLLTSQQERKEQILAAIRRERDNEVQWNLTVAHIQAQLSSIESELLQDQDALDKMQRQTCQPCHQYVMKRLGTQKQYCERPPSSARLLCLRLERMLTMMTEERAQEARYAELVSRYFRDKEEDLKKGEERLARVSACTTLTKPQSWQAEQRLHELEGLAATYQKENKVGQLTAQLAKIQEEGEALASQTTQERVAATEMVKELERRAAEEVKTYPGDLKGQLEQVLWEVEHFTELQKENEARLQQYQRERAALQQCHASMDQQIKAAQDQLDVLTSGW